MLRAQKVTFPGFDGIPLYDVGVFFWRSIVDGAITTRASAIAFSFFMALFPAIIFLFTLIPYIPIKNFQNELFTLIHNLVPGNVFVAIEGTVQDIISPTRPRGDLLSLGFFMALIFSTNGLASMMSAFDASLHSFERRSWLGQRFIAIVLLIIISLLLTATIALLTGGQRLINIAVEEGFLKDDFTYFCCCRENGRLLLLCSFLAIRSFISWLRRKKPNGVLFLPEVLCQQS
jgi:membrane protein